MDDHFSQSTVTLIEFAKSEACCRAHGYISTEHLLVGLLAEPENEPTVVTQSLKNVGIDLNHAQAMARQHLSAFTTRGKTDDAG